MAATVLLVKMPVRGGSLSYVSSSQSITLTLSYRKFWAALRYPHLTPPVRSPRCIQRPFNQSEQGGEVLW